MTMQLIKKFDEVFKNANLPLKLRPYEIVITSSSSGLIEFLPDTLSIDAIKKYLLPYKMPFYTFFYENEDFTFGNSCFTASMRCK